MRRLVLLLVVYPIAALVGLGFGAVATAAGSIAGFFGGAHPVAVVGTLAAWFAAASCLLGAFTRDYSWVDRLWSTAPVLFAWVYAVRAGFSPAPIIAAALVTLWGARLTFNFARRGGYTSIEDHRWPILRERIGNPLAWQLFNLLFISGYQVLLFVLFTLPVYRLAEAGDNLSVGVTGVFVALFVLFLAYETVADQQQWVFQNVKRGLRRRGAAPRWFGRSPDDARAALEADIERGFLTHGLFRLSRHPNYFGELAVWWTLYAFAAVAGGVVFDPVGIGAVLLTLLFLGSKAFAESITASRYPAYREYQRRTLAVIPWPAGAAAARGETRNAEL